MRHAIEHVRKGVWAPAVMVWDDLAGTLEWTRGPDVEDPMNPILMQAVVDSVERVRREGRIVLQTEPEPHRFVLEDAAHDPADFLRLIDYEQGWIRCGDVRLPPSLQDVEMTPPEVFDLPPGVIA